MESEKAETTDKNIFLQLGQILQINAPSNGKIHDKKFLIEYLDENLIKLINNDDYSILELRINNGILSDESIENITLLPPPPKEKGYAKLWGYLPGKWFSFHFGGNFYKVIHGQITNLEKDQIEIRTVYPTQETIYIDFGYKGIPLGLPLIKIVPFDPQNENPELEEEQIEEDYIMPLDDDGEEVETFVDFDNAKKEIQSQLLDLTDLNFDDVEEREMIEEKEVEAYLKRFSLDSQVSDLLESLLSNINANKRTTYVLNNVHKEIERFKELRILHSYFNEKGYVSKIKKYIDETVFQTNYKPLIQNIKHMDKLLWILPIIKTKKKLYDMGDMDISDYKDILKTTFAQMMTEEIEKYGEYKKSNISEEENKYKFYFKSIEQYYNPTNNLNDLNEILVRKRIKKNIETIVDNFDDFYSDNFGIACKTRFTKITPKPQLKNAQYVMNKSITGLTNFHLHDIKKFNFIGERQDMTSNDTVHIKGYMFLPHQVREYSRLHLTKTNILKRTTLNQYPLQYWKIFSNRVVNMNNYFVSANKNREQQFTATRNDINNINSYKYNQTIKYTDRKYSEEMAESSDFFFTDVSYENKDTFNIDYEEDNFLNSIVPSTDEVLNIIQEKIKFDIFNKSRYGMSIYNVLEFLEPYGIYNFNISDENYSKISKYCIENINWYKKTLNKNILEYQQYSSYNKKHHLNSIYNIIKNVGKNYESIINESYGLTEMDDNFYSNIIELDNGELFMNIISMMNIELSQNIDIEKTVSELVEDSEKTLKELEEESVDDDCKKFVLAKRYVDIDELKKDNEIDVYFDKKYDDTRYGIMELFKADKNILTANELLKKIQLHLINNVGVNVKNAERDAMALLEKKKIVVEGDYAILDIGDFDYKYYIRRDNKWRLDDSLSGKTLDEITFCNIQNKCLNINKNCVSLDRSKDVIQKKLLKQISQRFEDELILTTDELKEKAMKNYQYNLKHIEKLKIIKYNKFIEHDIYKVRLGELVASNDLEEPPAAYKYSLLILSDNNQVSKYTNIIKLVDTFCKEANYSPTSNEEEMYWYYDVETNYPVIPTFLYELATSYFSGDYDETMIKICDRQGVESDDGGFIVDRNSGYIIKSISFSEQEGYSESGFKIVTKSILEKEFSVQDVLAMKIRDDNFIVKSELSIKIQNIILSLDTNLNISTKNSHKFIIELVSDITNALKKKEDTKDMKKNSKRKKSFIDTILLYTTLGVYLVGLQTHIPNIKVKAGKIKGSCEPSFSGYPMENSSDESALQYLCCVVLNMKQSSGIWSLLPKKDKSMDKTISKFMKKLKNWINEKISNIEIVKTKILEKTKWISEHRYDIDITDDTDNIDWDHYLPPLKQIKVKRLSNITSGFESTVVKTITSLNNDQFAYLWGLKGKMKSFTFSIIESIHNIINNQPVLLKTLNNVEFLENSCCNDNMKPIIDFFSESDNSIYKENSHINNMYLLYNKFTHLLQPNVMVPIGNTRLIYPELAIEFHEETIYLAFIKYCRFYTGFNISEELKALCGDNNVQLDKKLSIGEKIEILKKNRHNYSNESLELLINIIHKNNMVKMILDDIPETPIREFEKMILKNKLADEEFCIYDDELLSLISKILDRFELNYSEDTDILTTSLNNYLNEKSEEMKRSIEEFLNGRVQTRKILKYIDEFLEWKDFGQSDYLHMDDEIGHNIYLFTKNIVNDILHIFPNIIKNDIQYGSIEIPLHWNLDKKGLGDDKGGSHASELQKMIEEEYNNNKFKFNNFQNNVVLNDFLKVIVNKNKQDNTIVEFIENLPFVCKFLKENSDKTIFDGIVLKNMSKFIFLCSIVHYINLFNIYVPTLEEDIIDRKGGRGAVILELERTLANLIHTYFLKINNYSNTIDKSAKEIKETILHRKEREKSKITKRFAEMSEVERDTEDELKRLKLGDWSVGLSKAIYEYDEKQFRKEAMDRENDRLIELRSGVANNFTNRDDDNRDSALTDYVYQQEIENRINTEVFNLDGFYGEDGEDEWGDGDERF